MSNTPNPTDNLYTPGTVVRLRDNEQAVYIGPAGRGLHAVAVTDTLAPYYESPRPDWDAGAARFPNLARSTWTPRKVRPGTIVDTHANMLRIAREAREQQQRDREAAEQRDRAERDALRRLSDAIDRLPLDVRAYEHSGRLAVYGPDMVDACNLMAQALDAVTDAAADDARTLFGGTVPA